MSVFVCLSVCLSVREHISGITRATFANFFVHVADGRGSVLLRQGDEIPRGRGNFEGLSGPFKSIGSLSCKRDHSIASNVMQQKGSFSMPGKRKWESEKFRAQAMRPVGREGGDGSALQRGRSLISIGLRC